MELKSETTLYAKYLQQYTLTLVSSFGSETTQQAAKLKLAPTPPEKEGYTFSGWYLDSSFRTPVVYPYILTADTTFYAKWVVGDGENFTVTFVTNGGTPIDEMQCSVIEESPVTTREGWKFVAWYTRSSLTGSAVRFPLTLTQNTTLYAKWTEDTESGDYTYESKYPSAVSSFRIFASKSLPVIKPATVTLSPKKWFLTQTTLQSTDGTRCRSSSVKAASSG